MCKAFLIHGEKVYSYSKLLEDLNKKEIYNHYIFVKDNNPYEIFLNLLHSMMHDYAIEMLDGDFSEEEIKNLGIDIKNIIPQKIKHKIRIDSLKTLINKAKSNRNWGISLYTSGTTGLPKKVTHTIGTITRNVKTGERFYNNIWGFAYNPTHMAGVQVFLQAIFNMNSIIYLFDQEILKTKESIMKFNITNLSATSTFYRNLVMYVKDDIFNSITHVTFGGEKFDNKIMREVLPLFPNAKIKNIYASTEVGSLFNGQGEIFSIPVKIKNLVRISDENELLIHKSLLGFSESFNISNDWYNTKDIIEKIDENHFKFISRKSDLINIGGYNVNPLEVEEIISNINEVKDIKVYARKNSVTGNILAADIVLDNKDKTKESEIKKTILDLSRSKLQQWKVPRLINIVESINQTRTGKKARL